MATLGAAATACVQPSPDPVPVADPAQLVHQLRRAGTPDQPQLIVFKWRYSGREGHFTGEGGVRVNPPDSVRLDLFGPDWSGVQSAILLGDDVRYIGERRVALPPPTFMWTLLGVFRPPTETVPQASRVGERVELVYRLSSRGSIALHFDARTRRLLEAELRDGVAIVERIRLWYAGEAGAAQRFAWPGQARYRDLKEFHEVRIEVREVRAHEPFEREIFVASGR